MEKESYGMIIKNIAYLVVAALFAMLVLFTNEMANKIITIHGNVNKIEKVLRNTECIYVPREGWRPEFQPRPEGHDIGI